MLAFKSLYDPSVLESLEGFSSRGYMQIAQTLMRIQQYDGAIKVLKQNFENDPGNPQTIGYLVSAFEAGGRASEAIELLESWVESNPGDRSATSMLNRLKSRNQ